MSSKYTRQDYIDYIKLMLTGNLLELEIPDETIGKYVDAALSELQRYIDETKLVTVPFAKCIDLGPYVDKNGVEHPGFKHSAIVHVYRTQGFTGDTTTGITTSEVDPMYAQTWSVFSSGGTMYNLQNYVMNYLSYNTLLQMRNTGSTDMSFREDKHANKLYINSAYSYPEKVTIEYVPLFENVEEVTSDYWIDILKRLSLALVKIGLGRIRTYSNQTNALWALDGEKMLTEGNEEIKELRQILKDNSVYFYPLD